MIKCWLLVGWCWCVFFFWDSALAHFRRWVAGIDGMWVVDIAGSLGPGFSPRLNHSFRGAQCMAFLSGIQSRFLCLKTGASWHVLCLSYLSCFCPRLIRITLCRTVLHFALKGFWCQSEMFSKAPRKKLMSMQIWTPDQFNLLTSLLWCINSKEKTLSSCTPLWPCISWTGKAWYEKVFRFYFHLFIDVGNFCTGGKAEWSNIERSWKLVTFTALGWWDTPGRCLVCSGVSLLAVGK